LLTREELAAILSAVNMTGICRVFAGVGLIVAATLTATAEDSTVMSPAPSPSAPPARSAADLERLAEPIALYPDPVLAVMLPAAVYPVECVQAARFVANTNNIPMLDEQSWDANVKAVAMFPAVIQKMSDELGWTVELGQAFLQQPAELMDAIQTLRMKAHEVGTLKTTPQQVVVVTNALVERTYEKEIVYVTNTVIQVVPANPQIIYVPVYTPTVVYTPPPTYIYDPMASFITFGAGVAVGMMLSHHHCDWHYGGVYYGPSRVVIWGGSGYRPPYYPPPPYYRPPPYYPPPGYRPPYHPPGYRPPAYPPGYVTPRPTPLPASATTLPAQRWQPDSTRTRGAGGLSSPASVNASETRGWGSGTGGAKPEIIRGTPGNAAPQPAATPNVNRPAQTPTYNRPATPSYSRDNAFSGMSGNVASTRDFSNRGSASRSAAGTTGRRGR
jgi:hypothetical protein